MTKFNMAQTTKEYLSKFNKELWAAANVCYEDDCTKADIENAFKYITNSGAGHLEYFHMNKSLNELTSRLVNEMTQSKRNAVSGFYDDTYASIIDGLLFESKKIAQWRLSDPSRFNNVDDYNKLVLDINMRDDEPHGFGIMANGDILETQALRLVLARSDNEDENPLGFYLSTAYPIFERDEFIVGKIGNLLNKDFLTDPSIQAPALNKAAFYIGNVFKNVQITLERHEEESALYMDIDSEKYGKVRCSVYHKDDGRLKIHYNSENGIRTLLECMSDDKDLMRDAKEIEDIVNLAVSGRIQEKDIQTPIKSTESVR